MHKTFRGIAAALVVAVLLTSLPIAAATPRPSRPSRIVQAARRVVDTLVPWLYSRLSPPGGTPTQDETPTTDPTTDKTQKSGT
ncbi:MAG TPA: hypothetical protein VF883_20505 [Thermoanaerobaculia bacterium]|jgi:hypothetical protein